MGLLEEYDKLVNTAQSNFEKAEEKFNNHNNKKNATALAKARAELESVKTQKPEPKKREPSTNRLWRLDWIVNFGKYKDDKMTVEEVIDCDRDYITWALGSIEWFELDNEAYAYFKSTMS